MKESSEPTLEKELTEHPEMGNVREFLENELRNIEYPRGKEELKLEELQHEGKFFGAGFEYNNCPGGPNHINFWGGFSTASGQLVIQNITVGASIRKKGIASQIIRMLERLAIKYGCEKSKLWRVQTIPGLRLAQSLGYEDSSKGRYLGMDHYKNLK
ncbi:GNAT family N-acetyltransferase [Candidatus Woesearchaeota archaeon]|nr:GNAT family N-acetyltransferase [Candidatus Woesearchaeota archaeon]